LFLFVSEVQLAQLAWKSHLTGFHFLIIILWSSYSHTWFIGQEIQIQIQILILLSTLAQSLTCKYHYPFSLPRT
jgi:hypothetical protein